MGMCREQKKGSEVESLEGLEVRRDWGRKDGNGGESRGKQRMNNKGWEHPHQVPKVFRARSTMVALEKGDEAEIKEEEQEGTYREMLFPG